ncbi:MAG: fimbrillin family protein [Bacteroides sp.]|nr:fimbrillin family protein [Bacteroides sp.]
MKRGKLHILIIACMLLAACTSNDVPDVEASPISFSATTESIRDTSADTRSMSADTRAGELTDATLSSMGVFAYVSNITNYNESSTQLNYIYNLAITKTSATWTPASPVYWPLNSNEKLTFFAYAPYSGVIESEGNALSIPAFNSAGHPKLTYTNNKPDIDLLIAIPQANLTSATAAVNFHMMHALTKLTIRVQNIGSNAIRVTGLTLKARKQGTLSCPPSTSAIAYASTGTGEEAYITYDENTALDITLDGGSAAASDIRTYYLMPDRTGPN